MNEQYGFISERKPAKKAEGLDPQQFGNYNLVRRIDAGGMGEVYLAHQRSAFGREVAVKIIRSDLVNDAQARQRFSREAEVGSYLKHDHILPLLEFGEEQGRLFIVTPYIKGGTLAQRLTRGALPITEVHDLFSALGRAVSYLHKRGIVHRDLKPANILLDVEEDSGQTYVRLIDFGIASSQGVLSGPLNDNSRTLGTADYTAPERLQGVAAPSNDIYSLGVILHVMLTGSLPRPETTQNLPIPLISVIDRCLETEPEDRFSSVDDLLLAFEHAYKSLTSSQKTRIVHPAPSVSAEASRPVLDDDAEETFRQSPDDSAKKPPARITGTHFALENRGTEPTSRPPLRATANGSPATSRPPVKRAVSSEFPIAKPGPVARKPGMTEEEASLPTDAADAFAAVRPLAKQATILPSLVQKGDTFKQHDYGAPTAELNPDMVVPKRKSRLAAANVLSRPGSITKPPKPPKTRSKRRSSPALVIFVIILVVLLVMAGVGYLILQVSTTATVTLSPRVQTVSSTFTFVAKPGVKSVDAAAGSIPASVLSNSQQSSTQGQPTGVSGCVLNIFECKETVSAADVSILSAKLRPKLQTLISQNLHKQASSMGVTLVGDIVYTDDQVTANPTVGTVSKTMTLSMTEKGSVEYFKPADIQSLAVQVLKRKLDKNYTLVDSTTKVGSPVVRSRDAANGNITIAIAAAGVASYQVPASELSDIKNHIKGDDLKQARAVVNTHTNFDQTMTAIRMSYGNNIPSNTGQIRIVVLNPTNMPTVTLPVVK
jgi:serine/threonine protein kinase